MRKLSVLAIAPIALTLMLTACGSTSNKTTSAASPQPQSSSSSNAASPSPTTAALISTKHANKLGTILAVGHKKMTVYLFEADKTGASACTGACAQVWPPVTGSPKALSGAMSADLGTITRPDGTKQVTYKGHPLYRYVKDKDDGDTYGQGLKNFGAEWYALSPAGNKIDES
jgi:predicted lipoprotein with Yx(FWY)xxD motif